ncbi:MAG: hypothetical protein KF841_15900 [Phycisphaerae bacterium]|nr:hypothetical protein [Phycisphaerae bacterium]
MRSVTRSFMVGLAVVLISQSSLKAAEVVDLFAVDDAFVSELSPASNFGGGGGLSVAASGLPKGNFQSVIRFDLSAAAISLDEAFGAGQWSVIAAILELNSNAPGHPMFNPQSSGQFSVSWMQDDSWIEGIGRPQSPTPDGVTYDSLPGFLSAGTELLGTFAYASGPNSPATYSLSPEAGFASDLAAGGLVSLWLAAADSSVSYTFVASEQGGDNGAPKLSLVVVPEPAVGLLVCAAALMLRRRR